MVDDPGTPIFLPRTFWLPDLGIAIGIFMLFAVVALVMWNWISLVILMALAAAIGRNFLKRRARRVRLATLRADYEQFSSGPCTFEADDNGWRHSSIRDTQ